MVERGAVDIPARHLDFVFIRVGIMDQRQIDGVGVQDRLVITDGEDGLPEIKAVLLVEAVGILINARGGIEPIAQSLREERSGAVEHQGDGGNRGQAIDDLRDERGDGPSDLAPGGCNKIHSPIVPQRTGRCTGGGFQGPRRPDAAHGSPA